MCKKKKGTVQRLRWFWSCHVCGFILCDWSRVGQSDSLGDESVFVPGAFGVQSSETPSGGEGSKQIVSGVCEVCGEFTRPARFLTLDQYRSWVEGRLQIWWFFCSLMSGCISKPDCGGCGLDKCSVKDGQHHLRQVELLKLTQEVQNLCWAVFWRESMWKVPSHETVDPRNLCETIEGTFPFEICSERLFFSWSPLLSP